MSQLNIRPLRDETEAHACAALMVATDPWQTIGFSAGQLFERLTHPKREAHIAVREGKIAGALILHLDGPLNGYIQTIVIFPEFQNRGFGRQLMAFAEERIFLQSPNVFLCVADFNHRALKFYQSLGYRKTGELENYLQSGITELLLRKTRGPLLGFAP